ncbi:MULTISPECIES: hypothetical protein [Clostridium]|nr:MULTISPECIES: hypothetical protein [Clostridium]
MLKSSYEVDRSVYKDYEDYVIIIKIQKGFEALKRKKDIDILAEY